MANDRLSELPECLLLNEILPKISFTDAIRCSLLCRRWRFLSRELSHLNFCYQDFENQEDQTIRDIINNALLHHYPPLHSFQLRIALADSRVHNWVRNWVHLAALKHVKGITLIIYPRNARTGEKLDGYRMFQLGQSVFECESLAALEVHWCTIPTIPADFGGFHYLKSCYMDHVRGLNDAIFVRLIELCPNLQNLGVICCTDLINLKISAHNLRYLYSGFLMPATTYEVVCPQLAEIHLKQYQTTSGLQLLTGVSRAESIEKITLQNCGGVNQEIPSFAVLDGFTRLEELTIHGQCFQEMISENQVPQAVTLPNLKKVHIHIGPAMDEKEVTLLGFLLRNYPLNEMGLILPPRCSEIIQNKVLDLKKEFPDLSISTG